MLPSPVIFSFAVIDTLRPRIGNCLSEIKKLGSDIRVLTLTMHNSEAFIMQMMELGANGYLIKNTDPNKVVKAIYKVIEAEFYFSE